MPQTHYGAISPLWYSDLGWLHIYADTTGIRYA